MVYRAKDISPSQLHYSAVKRSKSGRFTLITYLDNPLRIQLSKSHCDLVRKENRYFLRVNLDSEGDKRFFHNFDKMIRKSYIDNDNPVDHTHQLVDGSLSIRMTEDEAGQFAAKLYEPGKNDPKEIDYNKSNLGALIENRKLSVIIECIGIWFKNSKVGVTWKVNQMQLTPAKYPNKFAFVESDNDDDAPDDIFPDDSEF